MSAPIGNRTSKLPNPGRVSASPPRPNRRVKCSQIPVPPSSATKAPLRSSLRSSPNKAIMTSPNQLMNSNVSTPEKRILQSSLTNSPNTLPTKKTTNLHAPSSIYESVRRFSHDPSPTKPPAAERSTSPLQQIYDQLEQVEQRRQLRKSTIGDDSSTVKVDNTQIAKRRNLFGSRLSRTPSPNKAIPAKSPAAVNHMKMENKQSKFKSLLGNRMNRTPSPNKLDPARSPCLKQLSPVVLEHLSKKRVSFVSSDTVSNSNTSSSEAVERRRAELLRNRCRNASLMSFSLSASNSTLSGSNSMMPASYSMLSTSSSMGSSFGNEEAVKVCVRIRPVPDEHQRAWTAGPSNKTVVRSGDENTVNNVYHFDNVFGEQSSTEDVYEAAVQDIVSSVCRKGRNGTVFTYGQTSTGKTFTMQGIISAAAKDIYQFSDAEMEIGDGTVLACIKVSCLELYNEELRDLLPDQENNRGVNGSSSGLVIKEDSKGNIQVPNLTERVVESAEELVAVISEADTNRAVGSTAMNERSSRSHTIFRITYEKKEAKEITGKSGKKRQIQSEHGVECTLDGFDENGEDNTPRKKMVTTVSSLNLVDLAGSESVRHTGATGERRKEGGKINQSLLTLSTVLVKLGRKNQGYINYRDSKLTRILKPSLSGNARMAAICCITPLMQYAEESKSTLDFASRTMLVTTNASRNTTVEYDDAMVGEFEKEIERLKVETKNAEKGQKQLAQSLQESTEQIVCLTKSIEKEKKKVAKLEKQNYDFMMQVEELTLLNEELKTGESPQSPNKIATLLKKIEELTSHNEYLEKKMTIISALCLDNKRVIDVRGQKIA